MSKGRGGTLDRTRTGPGGRPQTGPGQNWGYPLPLDRTWVIRYTVHGMPLTITQENFLVENVCTQRIIYIFCDLWNQVLNIAISDCGAITRTIWRKISKFGLFRGVYLKSNIAQLYFIQRTSKLLLNFSSILRDHWYSMLFHKDVGTHYVVSRNSMNIRAIPKYTGKFLT